MKFISILAIVVLCSCCSSKPNKQTKTFDYAEFLNQLSQRSKGEDSVFGSKMSDTFRKWVPVWDTVFANDCKYRAGSYLDSVVQQNKLDSINQTIVTGFLDKYGYPNRYQTSSLGVYVIFIVIQHAHIKTQEKYYPVFIDAYKKGNLPGVSLALLEDRINMDRHRKQYYGTQHIKYENGHDYLYPVVNLDSLNAWRKQMDIKHTIEKEFEEYYNKKWDVDKYKKDLPDLIKKFKVTDSTPIRFVKQP